MENRKKQKNVLTERDEAILYLRKIRHLTLQDIATLFQVSRQRVFQILNKK